MAALGEKADQPLAELAKADLIKFRNALAVAGLAPGTVNHHLHCARMLFHAARRDGLLAENPCEFVANIRAPAKGADPKPTFSVEQLRAVLAHATPEWRSLVLFGLYTGQRLGDLALLCWSNIDLAKNELRLVTAKTGKLLSVPLAPPLARHIATLTRGAPQEPVHGRAARIVRAQGRASTLSREFGELLARAGLRTRGRQEAGSARLSFHSLRRTATTLLHEAGVPQAIAQAFIGHSSEAIHELYVAVGRESLARAAQAFPDLG